MVPFDSKNSTPPFNDDKNENKMNAEVRRAFSRVKPVCDIVMIRPSPESIATYTKQVGDLKKEALQELQQYVLFPVITHLRSTPILKKFELQCKLIDAMKLVLEKVTINCYEMCLNIETGLMNLIFDYNQTGMIATVPEEVKHSVMKCLTVLMLNLTDEHRITLLKTQVPLLAQAIFVSVHIAKLERLRPLRLAGLKSLMAHTCVIVGGGGNIDDSPPEVKQLAVDMVAGILPGVLAALQDVAACPERPGHAVIVTALEATHRILCLVMSNKNAPKRASLTTKDFVELIQTKSEKIPTEVSNKEKQKAWAKNYPKLSEKWFTMAGEKLQVVTKSIIAALRSHENHKVRKELAVYCARVLTECDLTMQPSLPMVIDVLMSLSNSIYEYPEVSAYGYDVIQKYLCSNASEADRRRKMDSLCNNFYAMLNSLPRIFNNIDSGSKQAALELFYGYLDNLKNDTTQPQKLTSSLTHTNMQNLCVTLMQAAAIHTDLTLLTQMATRDVTVLPPNNTPWCKLRNLDTPGLEDKFKKICRILGEIESSELIVDQLLELFQEQKKPEIVYIMNWMVTAPRCNRSVCGRVLSQYVSSEWWRLPLQVTAPLPAPPGPSAVYNHHAWQVDAVPDLFEGRIETRYTDIPYSSPRRPAAIPDGCCSSLAEAQHNMTLSCLMTDGVGMMATKLGEHFQPYLMNTLCLLLERVGSKYEMLHLSGLKAINDVALACNHTSVAELIRCNADYFTNQITSRLKKAWDVESALHILSVVMEYSDSNILDYLQAIVENVLVQSCDKHHDQDLYAYLQVFKTFIECIQKWFPAHVASKQESNNECDTNIFAEVVEYLKQGAVMNILLGKDGEELERSAEETMEEDLMFKDALDYEVSVPAEPNPLPQHIKVIITIIKRCVNFIPKRKRDESILAMQVVNLGLPLLRPYEDELLPIVHLVWGPLVGRFESDDPVVLKIALDLFVTMADVSKDFIKSRSVKEVLPNIYKYLKKFSENSFLKDTGSAYRNSQAFRLQVAALQALPKLVTELGLADNSLTEALVCVQVYLSKNQPKPLQALAVKFFQTMLEYDRGATWHHLRKFAANETPIFPPIVESFIPLTKVIGSPYKPSDKDFYSNIRLVFRLKI